MSKPYLREGRRGSDEGAILSLTIFFGVIIGGLVGGLCCLMEPLDPKVPLIAGWVVSSIMVTFLYFIACTDKHHFMADMPPSVIDRLLLVVLGFPTILPCLYFSYVAMKETQQEILAQDVKAAADATKMDEKLNAAKLEARFPDEALKLLSRMCDRRGEAGAGGVPSVALDEKGVLTIQWWSKTGEEKSLSWPEIVMMRTAQRKKSEALVLTVRVMARTSEQEYLMGYSDITLTTHGKVRVTPVQSYLLENGRRQYPRIEKLMLVDALSVNELWAMKQIFLGKADKVIRVMLNTEFRVPEEVAERPWGFFMTMTKVETSPEAGPKGADES